MIYCISYEILVLIEILINITKEKKISLVKMLLKKAK